MGEPLLRTTTASQKWKVESGCGGRGGSKKSNVSCQLPAQLEVFDFLVGSVVMGVVLMAG